MDDSLYESFRWLDEDADLDLRLDNYQTHVANSLSNCSQRRRSSFRRSLSFNSVNLSRRSTSLASYARAPISITSTEHQSSFANIISRRSSTSRPASKSQPRHVSKSSTSSIDPSAQYYQDPEARLKLRVYLASPQKFDEAVEFGFPAPKENEVTVAEKLHRGQNPPGCAFTGTFLADDDDDDDDDDGASLYSEKTEVCPNMSRLSYVMREPEDVRDIPFLENKRQSWMPQSKSGHQQRNPNMREMTLRMTLTRPDLRGDSSPTSSSVAEPLRLGELPSANENSQLWEWDADDQNLMKRMWRKFRGRRY